ncbi:diaminopimelate epimerase [Candidatus Deianiraea vastatrix]|uniref:Diaminopimelate epimerase n=1 Tax=Candidatus Deianiraea vastatrix TaxID=2163644 RepID=A0A5B8XEE9_9RICK|nr:hypothetical protein [Candidatus Deianiraea vastatrix]QED23719.1 Diaminopimelate epimerase [Candidatus Deianiraea vastatrix]
MIEGLIRDYKFRKFNNFGNDFIFLEGKEIDLLKVKFICDRRFGVGCDQLIIITKIEEGLRYYVTIYNADGSIAKMCGNAMICLGREYLKDGDVASVTIRYGAKVEVRRDEKGVSVKMPEIVHNKIENLINVGNMHRVQVVGDMRDISQKVSYEFNMSYIRILDSKTLFITTIERGVGRTLSCGSGIVASCYFIRNIVKILKCDEIFAITDGVLQSKIFGVYDLPSVRFTDDGIFYVCNKDLGERF